jgi:D-aspartate ligase
MTAHCACGIRHIPENPVELISDMKDDPSQHIGSTVASSEQIGARSCGGAIVVGANYRALGAVRSLGRHGIPVCVLKESAEILAAKSRFAQRVLEWPTGDDGEKIERLTTLASTYNLDGWLLIPTDDECARLIAQNHELLGRLFNLTTPTWEVLRWAYDKRLTYELSQRLGIDSPWTSQPGSIEEAAALDCPYPVIIKPAYKTSLNSLTAAKAWCVKDRNSMVAAYEKASKLVDPSILMIQELVPGGGESQFSFAALVRDGQTIVSLVARRSRQIPVDFGRFSTYVETTDEPAVIAPACRFLEAIRFTGIAEVEFKRDSRDGRYKLLDINPRLWGWHTLCARAGIDFTYLLWLLATGKEIPQVSGRFGIGWIRFAADLPVAIQQILRRRLSLRDYIRSLRRTAEEAIFAADDPLPAILDLPHMAIKLGKRLLPASGHAN